VLLPRRTDLSTENYSLRGRIITMSSNRRPAIYVSAHDFVHAFTRTHANSVSTNNINKTIGVAWFCKCVNQYNIE